MKAVIFAVLVCCLCFCAGQTTSVFNMGLVKNSISFRSILNNQEISIDENSRTFSERTLAYVTPWNKKGYEVSSKFTCKFDMISPTWYQVQILDNARFYFEGRNNVEEVWLQKLKQSTCNVKILPRINFLYRTFEIDKDEFVKYDYDGFVFDFGRTAFIQNNSNMVAFINEIAQKLHEKNKLFVLVIAPKTHEYRFITHKELSNWGEQIDFFSLMTYGYSSPDRPGPLAPINWIDEAIDDIVKKNSPLVSKILVGINFYGIDYNIQRRLSVPVVKDDIIKLLKSEKPRLFWDVISTEHYFKYKDLNYEDHEVWFPTLYFIYLRLILIQNKGCGLSIWEIGQGFDYFYDLL